jgi:hypothetical protein
MQTALSTAREVGTTALGPYVITPGLVFGAVAIAGVIIAMEREKDSLLYSLITAAGLPAALIAGTALSSLWVKP